VPGAVAEGRTPAGALVVVSEEGTLVGVLSARLPSERLSCGQNVSASTPATAQAAIAT
jgi:CBS domain-containing protein